MKSIFGPQPVNIFFNVLLTFCSMEVRIPFQAVTPRVFGLLKHRLSMLGHGPTSIWMVPLLATREQRAPRIKPAKMGDSLLQTPLKGKE